MNKRHHKVWIASVVLALALSMIYPYAGIAEENDQAERQQPAQEEPEQAGAAEAKPAPKLQLKLKLPPKEPAVMTKAAENSRFELLIDAESGSIKVVDKKTKKEWTNTPQAEGILPNNQSFIDSPVHIKYTEGADISQTYTLKPDAKTKLTVQNIDQGVRAEFELEALKLSFHIEYRLLDDGLEVTIPYSSIKEGGTARLIGLEVLPFFNAGSETEEGALFIPDGSGALMIFRENHPKYYSGYSEPVYGPDLAFKTQSYTDITQMWRREKPPKESIALPVFGTYRNGTGFLGIITEGDKDALINGIPAGIRNIPLYRTSAEFIYRKFDVIFIGSSGQIPLFQGAKTEGDRKVRYVLLEGEDANYVGMAKAYRDYLMKEQGVKPAVPETMPMNVRLLGGILRDEIIGSTFIKMTTFDQAKSIIDEYAAKGVNNLQLTLTGWSKGGLYGNQPDHFPVEKKLGGAKGLKELTKYAQAKGGSVYLQANYVKPYQESKGFSARKDTIRGIDREAMEVFNTFANSGVTDRREKFYLIKPGQVSERRAEHELDEFAGIGAAGVSLKYMGDTLYSDVDPKTPLSRRQTADAWVSVLDKFKKKVGHTAVDYGFAYTLGHVDRIDNAPLDSSRFVYTDLTVPFFQIALHGLVLYAAEPSNLRDDSRVQFLRAIEYGATPSFELTYEPTSKLQRTMEDRLLSSGFSHWLEPSVAEYREFAKLYDLVGDRQIVNHERLSEQVYRTTYAGGTQIIVNYGAEAATIGGISVKGLDYAVTEGGS
ncbi:DUF5696 domain-containing protein [Paenibacillus thermotolerans]|uniref:DUF5696 domain-containing protein n=1 Tax=Paenibacillus thermotolerans TaxID=3027807 RepID=UPI002367936C|nr:MULTISPECIES: DUF5696 domain-containing protein [unclassified Paenibacillus]